ncbi:unnamed protein product [Owenia fusiformis]|uniref:Uncharacterized protein n=1 Tax=Owenia fusiformis TaxID=6347 RepID=A0A8J1TLB8_OWEFU|nr:unnamed protein product [Owenia fusiformis]
MSDKIQQPLFRQSAPSVGFSPPVPPFLNTTNYTVPQVVNSEHIIAPPASRAGEIRPIARVCAQSSIVQPTPLSAMSSPMTHFHNTGLSERHAGIYGQNLSLRIPILNSNIVNQQMSMPHTNIPPTAGNITNIEDVKNLGLNCNITKAQTSLQPPFMFNMGDIDSTGIKVTNQKCNTVWGQSIPTTFQWESTRNLDEEFGGSSSQNAFKSRRVLAKRKAARDSPIPTKVYITEKEMARRISNLNLDGTPPCRNRSLFSDLDPKSRAQKQLDEIDMRLQAIEDEDDEVLLEEEMTEDLPKLQLSDEVKKSLNVAAELLPHDLLAKIPPSPSPNMQVVLWKPNNDVVKEVIQSVLNNKNRKRGTSPVTVETVNQSNGMSVTLNRMDGIDDAPLISKSLPYDNINKRGHQEPLPMDDMDE